VGAAHPAGQVRCCGWGTSTGARGGGQTLGTAHPGKARPGAGKPGDGCPVRRVRGPLVWFRRLGRLQGGRKRCGSNCHIDGHDWLDAGIVPDRPFGSPPVTNAPPSGASGRVLRSAARPGARDRLARGGLRQAISADGQTSFRTHPAARVARCADRRPCRISRSPSGSTRRPGPWSRRPPRSHRIRRRGELETGGRVGSRGCPRQIPALPKATPRTTLAVLRPTPRRVTTPAIRSGTSPRSAPPPSSLISMIERPWPGRSRCCGSAPPDRRDRPRRRRPRRDSGKEGGVTRLTRSSVHWAERMVATRSCSGPWWTRAHSATGIRSRAAPRRSPPDHGPRGEAACASHGGKDRTPRPMRRRSRDTGFLQSGCRLRCRPTLSEAHRAPDHHRRRGRASVACVSPSATMRHRPGR